MTSEWVRRMRTRLARHLFRLAGWVTPRYQAERRAVEQTPTP